MHSLVKFEALQISGLVRNRRPKTGLRLAGNVKKISTATVFFHKKRDEAFKKKTGNGDIKILALEIYSLHLWWPIRAFSGFQPLKSLSLSSW